MLVSSSKTSTKNKKSEDVILSNSEIEGAFQLVRGDIVQKPSRRPSGSHNFLAGEIDLVF